MRREIQPPLRHFAAMGVAAALAAGLTSFAPSASAQPNTAPNIIPSLQSWNGGEGRFVIDPAARIVTDDAELDDVAAQFADDLEAATGLDLTVVDGAARAGDLILEFDETLVHEAGGDNFLNEGYILDVTVDRVTISAPSVTGVFYGTRTLLQGLVQSPGRSSFPVGTTTDWPSYESRGFMLDVGRRFFTAEFIRDYIQMMSWYKMNEFQIHLNDNELRRPDTGWQDGYSGFRLKSDNLEFADLASEDGAYDRADWQSFEDLARSHSVQIVPEIDVPAHSLAFIQWRPALGLNGGDSDHLDLTKPATTETIKDVFDEFVPWFEGPEVHYGADEYPREHADAYRTFFNDMAEHVRSLGKHPRAWGSMSVMHGSSDGYDKDVTINAWNNSWYGMASALADGYEFINTNDSSLYIVPFADYYHGYGLNNQGLYSSWLPNRLWNTDTVPAGAPQGAMFAVWNDLVDADYTQLDVHRMARDSFPVIAQKTWHAATPTLSYADFTQLRDTLAAGPGLTLIDEAQHAQGDLAVDAAVTASSATSGNPVDNLLDGRQYTRWQSEGDDASFTIDLGEPATVGEVKVEWAQPLPASFDVELSYDGVAWLPAASGVSGEEPSTTTDPTLARYIRVTAEGEGVGAWSVSVFGPPALTVGATATASGNEAPNLDASQAVDGNLTTRWSANYVDRPWLAVDLGEAKTFSKLELAWEAASATGYVIEVSDDGSSWEEVASRTAMADGARTDLVEFDEVTARHVRVTVTAKSLTPYLSLYELSIPAPEAAAPAPLTLEEPADEAARVGETVSIELSASGTGPLTWSAAGLPHGLALDAGTGVISGTPSSAGTTAVEVTVTDAAGYRVSATMQLTVEAATPTTPPVTPPVTTPPATPPAGPEFVRTAPYTIPGKHFVNGRDWHTTCEPYSQTERCLTEIWASVVKRTGNTFTIERGWAFNNLTYLPFMKREQWSTNPLGYAGSWTATDGTLCRTECDTALTGGSACRSFRWTTVYDAQPKPGGGYSFGQDNTWVFNNLVMFGTYSR